MSFKFPEDLSDEYYMSLSFKKYDRPDPFTTLMRLAPISDGGGPSYLPLPANLVDSQSLNWEQGNGLLGEVFNDIWKTATNYSDANKSELIETLKVAGITGAAQLLGVAGSVAAGATGGAVGSQLGAAATMTTKALLQQAGLALNPVLTQMFTSPEFKTHQFSWKFSPNTRRESDDLYEIIDDIKSRSLPEAISGGAFFKYPDIAIIRLHVGSNDLYSLKPCVIKNVEVNYAASGVPSFFANSKSATSIQLTISLLEIELNTRNNSRSNISVRTENQQTQKTIPGM